MAFPFKTGGDFYNCEAQRMRLHNLGANPTETATGLMYFNTGASNLGKHAVVHDGTNFKALAFVDEIATNTAFTELADRVLTIEKALGEDTANVIDTWEEIQNFLKDIDANDANLMTMLDDKLSMSKGGALNGDLTMDGVARIKMSGGIFELNSGADNAGSVWLWHGGDKRNLRIYDGKAWNYAIHSGNIGDYNAGSATKLQTARTIWGQSFDGTGDVDGNIVSAREDFRLYNKTNRLFLQSTTGALVLGEGTAADASTYILGKDIYFGSTLSSKSMLINSSGNVTIGGDDLASTNYRLYVNGKSLYRHAILADRYNGQGNMAGASIVINKGSDFFGIGPSASDKRALSFGTTSNDSGDWKSEFMTIAEGGNVGIGTTAPKKKLHVVGDLYVDGNIIATKEVSAGGAGQEGESGAGGAEVIDAPIPSGVTTYTIPNTIGRSAVAVSLYEANVINGQTIWSLCLADIEVTNETITVTFGSATSVNHKLVAVG